MAVILKITGGPCVGTKIHIPRGQIAHVGRTRWADHSLPGDGRLALVPAGSRGDEASVRARDASGERAAQANGGAISEIYRHRGDMVLAGQGRSQVSVEGEPVAAAAETD